MAVSAPRTVHLVRGFGSERIVAALRADREIQLVASPRHAGELVVAGDLPETAADALRHVYDQIAPPRQVTHLPADPSRPLPLDLPAGPPLGPSDDPVDWQGRGDHGQGGEGMMGGTPYGRPMAMPPKEGRDGLALDRLPLRLGPFLAGFPPLLVLDVGLQGDVLETVSPRLLGAAPAVPADDPFVAALLGPVPIATLERARAGAHLAELAELLALCGLGALARRAARTALEPSPAGVRDLARRLRRRWVLRPATDGVGVVDADMAPPGPARRAAGDPTDARSDDPAYRELGFEPVVGHGGDVTARWSVWLAEAEAALDLADRAGDRTTTGVGTVETPSGPRRSEDADPAGAWVGHHLAHVLAGQEIGRAVVTLQSLRLDLRPVTTAHQLGGVA